MTTSEPGDPRANGGRPDDAAPGPAADVAPDEAFTPELAPAEALLTQAIRRGRLRLRGLSRGVGLLALLTMGTILLAGLVLLANAARVALPGGVVELPAPFAAGTKPVPVPVAGIVATLAAAAVLAGAGAASALLVPRRRTRPVLLGIGLVAASLVAQVVTLIDFGAVVAPSDPMADPILRVSTTIAFGAAALLVAGGLLVPRRRMPGFAPLLAALAATPALAMLVAFVAGLGGRTELGAVPPAGLEGFPATFQAVPALIAAPLFRLLAYLLPLLLIPFTLWQATTWARAARDVAGTAAARAVERRSWVLPALLAGKAAWLVLGFAGLLPVALGGGGTGWASAANDGVLAWLAAATFAGGVGVFLASGRVPKVADRSLRPGVAWFVAGFSLVAVTAATLLLLGGLLMTLPTDGPSLAILGLVDRALGLIMPAQLLTMLLAPVAGAFLLRAGRTGPGLLLVVAGLWALPRAVGVALEPDLAVPSTWPLYVELATLDVMVTAAVAAVAILAAIRAGGRLPAGTGAALALVLVVSTLVGQTGSLVPADVGGKLALLALLFPPLYELLFESGRLNAAGPTRNARVVGVLASRAAALWLVVAGIGVLGREAAGGEEQLARMLFAPGYAALAVVVALGARSWRGHPEPAADAGPAATPVPAAAASSPARLVTLPLPIALATGVVVVLVATALGSVAADPLLARVAALNDTATPVPSPAASVAPSATAAPLTDEQAFVAFQAAMVRRTEDAAKRIATDLPAAAGSGDAVALLAAASALRAGAVADFEWVSAQDIRPCYVGLAEAYTTTIAAEDAMGIAFQDIARGTGSEQPALDAIAAYDTASDGLEKALVAAGTACLGITPAPSPSASPG